VFLPLCSPCPPGAYTAQNGSAQCLPCPIGTFQASQASSHCELCQVGSANALLGQAACAGHSLSLSFPHPLSVETTCAVLLSVTEGCAAGSFSNETGLALCYVRSHRLLPLFDHSTHFPCFQSRTVRRVMLSRLRARALARYTILLCSILMPDLSPAVI
jgi:hypothetical protein